MLLLGALSGLSRGRDRWHLTTASNGARRAVHMVPRDAARPLMPIGRSPGIWVRIRLLEDSARPLRPFVQDYADTASGQRVVQLASFIDTGAGNLHATLHCWKWRSVTAASSASRAAMWPMVNINPMSGIFQSRQSHRGRRVCYPIPYWRRRVQGNPGVSSSVAIEPDNVRDAQSLTTA